MRFFKKFLFIILLFLSLSLGSYTRIIYATDNTVKIGVLDLQQIMQQSSEVTTLNKQLKAKFKPLEQKLISDRKAIQNDINNFAKNQLVMKAADKEKTKSDLMAKQVAYERSAENFQKELNTAQSQGMQKFMSHLENAVNTVAKKEQFTLILNRTAVPYFAKENDVTSKILAQLNQ